MRDNWIGNMGILTKVICYIKKEVISYTNNRRAGCGRYDRGAPGGRVCVTPERRSVLFPRDVSTSSRKRIYVTVLKIRVNPNLHVPT